MISVLFVCIGNACRSQMAEAWLRHLAEVQGRKDIDVFSAGSNPLGSIPAETIEVMNEVGIDLAEHWSKSIEDLPQKKFDYVISLCGDRCPNVPATEHIDMPIPDPIGKPIEEFRKARDMLHERVKELLEAL